MRLDEEIDHYIRGLRELDSPQAQPTVAPAKAQCDKHTNFVISDPTRDAVIDPERPAFRPGHSQETESRATRSRQGPKSGILCWRSRTRAHQAYQRYLASLPAVPQLDGPPASSHTSAPITSQHLLDTPIPPHLPNNVILHPLRASALAPPRPRAQSPTRIKDSASPGAPGGIEQEFDNENAENNYHKSSDSASETSEEITYLVHFAKR